MIIKIIFLLVLSALLSAYIHANVVKDAEKKLIDISANKINMDDKNSFGGYYGDVVIYYDSGQLEADKVLIYEENNRIGEMIAYGRENTPAIYQRGTEGDEDFIYLEAQKIIYKTVDNFLQLEGSVYVKRNDGSIKAHTLQYDLDKKEVTTTGQKNQKVESSVTL